MTQFNDQPNPFGNDDWANAPPVYPPFGQAPTSAFNQPPADPWNQVPAYVAPQITHAPAMHPAEVARRQRTVRNRIRAGVGSVLVVAAVAGGSIGAYKLSHQEKDPYEDNPFAESRLSNESEDPSFRAEAVSALKDGFKAGSASLIRRGDQISVVTVEHVARPLSGMPSTIKEKTNGMVIGDLTPKTGDVRFNVPSIGLLENDAEPIFIGDALDDRGEANDRVAYYELTSEQQADLAVANATGQLKIPQASSYKPSFGEVLEMPTPNLGKGVKLVYLGDRGDTHELIPLVMLDEGMDVTKGLERLAQQEIAEVAMAKHDAAESAAKYLQKQGYETEGKTDQQLVDDALKLVNFATTEPTAETIRNSALLTIQTEFADTFDSSTADLEHDGQAIANNLVCHGDSGGVLVDPNGGVMGVLSQGHQLYNSKNEPINMTREIQNQTCLGITQYRIVQPGS